MSNLKDLKLIFNYSVDAHDVVTKFSSNWGEFAEKNGWDEVPPTWDVLGRPLWEFIAGEETRHLYEKLFEKARAGRTIGPIPFRCDSPDEKRFLSLKLVPGQDGALEITSIIERTVARPHQPLLDISQKRSEELLRICSMCKKIVVPPERWLELEDGVSCLRLFEEDQLPRLTHGLCPYCFATMMAEIMEHEAPVFRAERDEDRPVVHQLNLSAFGRPAEAELVDVLRDQAQPIISLVAESDGTIVGHIMFSPMSHESGSKGLMALAPMAVAPERQRQGIGSALVWAGLEACRELEMKAVMVLGHPDYYPRFGFVPASEFSLRSEFEVPENAFLALELEDGALASLDGMVQYHQTFNELC